MNDHSPEETFLRRVWGNRFGRAILIVGFSWQVLSGLVDFVGVVNTNIVQPMYLYVSATPPPQESVKYERQSFLLGYLIHQSFLDATKEQRANFPTAVEDTNDRVVSILEALSIPSENFHAWRERASGRVDFLAYQRQQHQIEAQLDLQSESALASYKLGQAISIIEYESAQNAPSKAGIYVFLEQAAKSLEVLRSASDHRVPSLPLDSMTAANCCKGYESLTIESFLRLKKYFWIGE